MELNGRALKSMRDHCCTCWSLAAIQCQTYASFKRTLSSLRACRSNCARCAQPFRRPTAVAYRSGHEAGAFGFVMTSRITDGSFFLIAQATEPLFDILNQFLRRVSIQKTFASLVRLESRCNGFLADLFDGFYFLFENLRR